MEVSPNSSTQSQINGTSGISFTLTLTAALVLNPLCMACSLWVGLSLVMYGLRKGKWSREKRSDLIRVSSGPMFTCAVAAPCFALARLVVDNLVLFYGHRVVLPSFCDVAIKAASVFYILVSLCYFLVLWLRLHCLYGHIGAVLTLQAWAVGLKWAALALGLSGAVGSAVAFSAIARFEVTPEGCKKARGAASQEAALYSVFSVLFVSQALLIYLFAHPLRFQLKSVNGGRVLHILKRSTAVAAACSFTDLLAALAAHRLFPPDQLHDLALAIGDLNVCVNVCCILLSFSDWRRIAGCAFRRNAKRKKPQAVDNRK